MKRSHLVLIAAAVGLYLYSKRSVAQNGFAAGAPAPTGFGAAQVSPNDPYRYMY